MAYNDEKGGRPPKWDNVEAFIEQSEGFFDHCKEKDEIPDVEGLAVYLDTTRKTLFEYQEKKEFSNAIKKIKEKIFHSKKQLAMKGKMPPAIFIFDSVNNHEYQNKQNHDHTTKGEQIKGFNYVNPDNKAN